MSNNIDVKSAAAQFTKASLDLAYATLHYPLTGSWKRLVIAGPVVLLLASGTGALVYSVTIGIFRGVLSGIYKGSQSVYNTCFRGHPGPRVQPQPPRPFNFPLPPPQPPVAANAQPAPAAPAQILPPPQEEIAKMRNEALLKLLPHIEKYALDPLMQRKEIQDLCSQEKLKQWLHSMTLCLLGLTWDKLETQYVQFRNPPLETVDSIIEQVKKMNPAMGALFEQKKTLENYKEILVAIGDSGLPISDKMALTAFYYSLDAILNKSGDEVTQRDDKIKINRAYFAKYLSASAYSLQHITEAVEVWVKALKEPQPAPVSDESAVASPQAQPIESDLSAKVAEVKETLKTELTNQYLIPLWNSKSEERYQAVLTEAPEESRQLCQDYIYGTVTEKYFLEHAQSFKLSTSLTSKIFFMRAVFVMGNDEEALRQSTQAIIESVFVQLQPTLTEALNKASNAISQIPLQKVVPPMMDQVIQILQCCKILQGLYKNPNTLEDSFIVSPAPSDVNNDNNAPQDDFVMAGGSLLENIITVVQQAKGDAFDYENLRELFSGMKPHPSGRKIVEELKENGIPIHPIVFQSFDTPQWERNWIHGTKERFKTVLRIYADKYSQREGSWVSRLFKSNLEAQEPTLISKLFSIPAKLHSFPVLEEIMSVLFMGVESAFESKGIDIAQKTLNDYTSTGDLSSLIGVKVVKKLITKDKAKWSKNLPVLQEAYQYLHPEEKKIIDKHLKVVFGPAYDTNEITSIDVSEKNSSLLASEENCKSMMNQMLALLASLEKNTEAYKTIVQGVQKIKREHELLKFERVRTLVTTVAEMSIDLPEEIKQIITKTIFEAMPLLTCQELVKHWIFSIVDLLVKELEETTRPKKDTDPHDPFQETTLTELIPDARKSDFLASLTSLVQSDYTSLSGLGVNAAAGLTWLLRNAVTRKVDAFVWNKFSAYVDAKISPQIIADTVIDFLLDFGKDKNSLSDSIIDVLKEHVADPRKPENRE